MDGVRDEPAFWPLGRLNRLKLALSNRRRLAPPPLGSVADIPGFAGLRTSGYADYEPHGRTTDASPDLMRLQTILALSGGGASGAFGAGALVGLTQAGARTEYRVVTGVSTGALIAPFAFVGPDWDKGLTEAFTGAHAAELIGVRALRPGGGGGLIPADALETLIARFADAALLDAVAERHGRGRRLLVTTTDLDTLGTSIWDLGAIAARGGEAARELFVGVLAAAASLPGLFAPRMIRVEVNGESFEEMHADGGIASPLLLEPGMLIPSGQVSADSAKAEVHAIINTSLQPTFREMPVSIIPILARSFDLMLAASYRAALRSAAELCERHDLTFKTTSLPVDLGRAHWMRFDQRSMARTFERGVEMGRSGNLWSATGF